jgi:hypothetical protein
MAITTDQLTRPADVTNLFKTNVVNIVVSSDLYHSGILPSLSGTAGTFIVPAADMDPLSAVQVGTIDIGSTDEDISGQTVYNVLLGILRNFSRVRNFRFELYYNGNLERSMAGKGVFKTTLPAIGGGYIRNLNGSLMAEPSVSNSISGTSPDAGDITRLFTNMLNAWRTIANTQLVYQYMSCHSSCHSDHANRGRR